MILLLPGIQAGPAEFARLTPLLRGRVHVEPLPETEDDDLPTLARRVLERVGPGPFDVVAASFGGLVAWAMPPGVVRSLCTIGTLPRHTPAARRAGRVGRWLGHLPERVYREWYGARVRASLAEDGADGQLLETVRPPPPRVLAARLRAIDAWALPARPPSGSTWMWGATDRFVTWEAGDILRMGAEPLVVPGGHRPHLSHPSEVARWITRSDAAPPPPTGARLA
jgi:pimeloyl-ACP methyl ester carboxylesterase